MRARRSRSTSTRSRRCWACDPSHADRMSAISHQAYGPLTGVPRLLKILARHNLTSTFFVPGYTAVRYPDVIRSIVADGHEIAHHGYLHEPMRGTDRAAGGRHPRPRVWMRSSRSTGVTSRRLSGADVGAELALAETAAGQGIPLRQQPDGHRPPLRARGRRRRPAGRDSDPVGTRRLGAVLLRAGVQRQRADREPEPRQSRCGDWSSTRMRAEGGSSC